MFIKTKVFVQVFMCFVAFGILTASAGCSNDAATLPETKSPVEGPSPESPVKGPSPEEAVEPEDPLTGPDALEPEPGPETEPKQYGNYLEAYLDILMENHSILTDVLLSDEQIRASGIDIGDGKIAILDVLGDETPELLYIYTEPDITDHGSRLFLSIFTFSEGNVDPVFDSSVYSPAGAGNNYCIYLDCNGELIEYFGQGGANYYAGFWPINTSRYLEDPKDEEVGPTDMTGLAQLYYGLGLDGGEIYLQYGKEISRVQFGKASEEIMGNVAQVIFHGIESPRYGVMLYLDNIWKDVTPFEESCMTYAEAIASLEAQRYSSCLCRYPSCLLLLMLYLPHV